MSRDSQAALVALHRFGLGARGGASGDFVNAASDPRGFVKAELARSNGALLEAPGLQSTPMLAEAAFAYQLEVRKARDAAAKSGQPAEATAAPASEDKPQRRNLSLDAMDMAAQPPAAERSHRPDQTHE